MKIGIIGTKWGLVHIGTFREAGLEIDTLMGLDLQKVRDIARREKIPHATTRAADLMDMDVVVVASPANTHWQYISLFKDKHVLCEKPLTGAPIDPKAVGRLAGKSIYVNYAFPFLKTARTIDNLVRAGRIGEVFRILVNVSPHFEIEHTPVGWFMDDAVHPLSWLNHLFGPFHVVHSHCAKGRPNISTTLTNGKQVLNLNLYQAYRVQLLFDITFVGTAGVLHVSGGFVPGHFWNLSPVRINGELVTRGERSTKKRDIWFSANAEAVRTFVDVIQGRISRKKAVSSGLADLKTAAQIEQGLSPMMAEWGP